MSRADSATTKIARKSPSIHEAKLEILRRAERRQELIHRGEYDVPIQFKPLPMMRILDLVSQLDYRHDSLHLAVPPKSPAFGERFKRFCKNLVCTSLRWLLIRQVEFNTLSLEHAREATELLALADQNQGEMLASLSALKIQIHHLARRMSELESGRQTDLESKQAPSAPQLLDKSDLHTRLFSIFKKQSPALLLGCGSGELLKHLQAEGMVVQGVEPDPALALECKEQELPVVQEKLDTFLEAQADDVLGLVHIDLLTQEVSPRDLAKLLGLAWDKLAKNGTLVIELGNPICAGTDAPSSSIPAELANYILESRSFTIEDWYFAGPLQTTPEVVVRSNCGIPFGRRQYRWSAVVASK